MANNGSIILTGAAAKAVLHGDLKAAMAVGIAQNKAWDSEKERYTEDIDSYIIDVTSPATRFQKISVKVPPDGYCIVNLTDGDLDAIAQGGGTFPLVMFDGLTVEMYTRKDSRVVSTNAKATAVYLCDENGKAVK